MENTLFMSNYGYVREDNAFIPNRFCPQLYKKIREDNDGLLLFNLFVKRSFWVATKDFVGFSSDKLVKLLFKESQNESKN